MSVAKAPLTPVLKTEEGIYQQLCASCHGVKLQGTATAKGFVNMKFRYGSDKKSIVASITNGITDKGMPAWKGAINSSYISKLADFIIAKSKK